MRTYRLHRGLERAPARDLAFPTLTRKHARIAETTDYLNTAPAFPTLTKNHAGITETPMQLAAARAVAPCERSRIVFCRLLRFELRSRRSPRPRPLAGVCTHTGASLDGQDKASLFAMTLPLLKLTAEQSNDAKPLRRLASPTAPFTRITGSSSPDASIPSVSF